MGCCKITLPILNLHGRFSAWLFSPDVSGFGIEDPAAALGAFADPVPGP